MAVTVAPLAWAAMAALEVTVAAETGGTTGQEFPCTEQGIRDAIAEGGGPHTFACDGQDIVVLDSPIEIINDVFLDGGGGRLMIDGSQVELAISNEGETTLRGFRLIGSDSPEVCEFACGVVANAGTLALIHVNVSGSDFGVHNTGTLNVMSTTLVGNGVGIENAMGGELTLTNSTVSGNADVGVVAGGMTTVSYTTFSENGFSLWYGGDAYGGDALTLTSSLLADPCDVEDGADVTSNGYNIESPADTCGLDQTGDQANVSADDLKLGPLQDLTTPAAAGKRRHRRDTGGGV